DNLQRRQTEEVVGVVRHRIAELVGVRRGRKRLKRRLQLLLVAAARGAELSDATEVSRDLLRRVRSGDVAEKRRIDGLTTDRAAWRVLQPAIVAALLTATFHVALPERAHVARHHAQVQVLRGGKRRRIDGRAYARGQD